MRFLYTRNGIDHRAVPTEDRGPGGLTTLISWGRLAEILEANPAVVKQTEKVSHFVADEQGISVIFQTCNNGNYR